MNKNQWARFWYARMTNTLQEKIDAMKPFPTLTEKILRTEVNKAIQELREEIELRWDNAESYEARIAFNEVLSLIGEKK